MGAGAKQTHQSGSEPIFLWESAGEAKSKMGFNHGLHLTLEGLLVTETGKVQSYSLCRSSQI